MRLVTSRVSMLIADRYRADATIGSGGMGDIIQCVDTHLDRRVVIKTLQPGVDHSRLLDEQRALMRLRSKHVVQLYDIVAMPTTGASGLVLEYIDGRDLTYGGSKADGAYIKLLWQIACGLRDIHKAGVIHRDLKPGNARMDTEGVVKIFDFGLARSVGIDDRTRSIIGTPIFMAPELWGQTTISLSTAIDVYAFGVTAIALLNVAVPSGLQSRPPLPVRRHEIEAALAGLPPDLVGMVSACLAHRHALRPSMSDVADLLERHLLYGRHRAIAVINGVANRLDMTNRTVSMKVSGTNQLSIQYDGHAFKIGSVAGYVYINNKAATVGDVIPGCCVLTFGVGSNRTFVTFDISNPEVIA